MSTWDSCSMEVGILLCGRIRGMLDRIKFLGWKIEYLESSGWLSRTFIVKGPSEDIEYVRRVMNGFMEAIDKP